MSGTRRSKMDTATGTTALMGRIAWQEPNGNQGRGTQWFPVDYAFTLATFYKRGAPARRVWVEFPDETREEVIGEPQRTA
jgi:hypothetical protein